MNPILFVNNDHPKVAKKRDAIGLAAFGVTDVRQMEDLRCQPAKSERK